MGEMDWGAIEGTGVTTQISGSDATWKDADTFRQNDTDYRIRGLDADETWKVVDGEVKTGEWLGNIQTQEFGALAESMGFDTIRETGDETHGRKVADLLDKNGNNFTDALYENGLVPINQYSSTRQQELAEYGFFSRGMREQEAKRLGKPQEVSGWDTARDNIANFKRGSVKGWKQLAMNERELRSSAGDGDDYSQYLNNEVMFRHGGQDMHGFAINPFSAGMSQGWNSIKESAHGGLQVLGDIIDNDYLYDWGKEGAARNRLEHQDAPQFVQDIGKVEFGENFGSYLAGMAGVSLPYMLGIIGSGAAGAVVFGSGLAGAAAGLTAPTWVYAGEVYNGMEGDKSQKNAAAAVGAGILMATADRLGLQAIMKSGKSVLGKGSIEILTKEYMKVNGVNAAVAREAVAKAQLGTAKEMLSGLAAQAGKNFGRGAAGEAVTEAFQEGTGFLASHFGSTKTRGDDVNWKEFKNITLNAAIGGGLLGGGISGVGSTASEYRGAKQLQHEFSTATNEESEGFLEKNLEEEFKDRLAETYEGDSQFIVDSELKKAKKARKDKGFLQKLVDAPSKVFRKRGSIWAQKIIENPDMPQAFKDTVKVINSMFMPGNKSYAQGDNMWATQQRAEQTFIRENHDVRNHLTATFGLTTSKADQAIASDLYTEWVRGKQLAKKGWKAKPEAQAAFDAKFGKIEPQLEALHTKIDNMTEGLRHLVNDATGDNVGKKENWFVDTLEFDPNEMVKDKPRFINALVDGSGYSKDKATELYNAIVFGKDFEDKKAWQVFDKQHKSTKNVKANLAKNELLNDFKQKNLFDKMDSRIKKMTQYAADSKYLGKHDEKLNQMLALAKEQAGDAWDPEYALAVKEMVDSNRGRYKQIKSKKAKEAIKNISFVGAITQLDTSMLASLPEAALVFNTASKEGGIGGLVSKAWKANKKHFKGTAAEAKRKVSKGKIPTVEEINPTEDEIDLQRRTFYGSGWGGTKSGVLGAEDIERGDSTRADQIRESILENFFRANLLKPYTDGSRVARAAIANDAIFNDLDIMVGFYKEDGGNTNYSNDAYFRLRDLKINPVTTMNDYKKVMEDLKQLPPDTDKFQYIYKNFPELYQTMELARESFVNNMLAKPTIVDRPLFYSNPHFRLFTQYQGFLSTFTAHILPRLYNQAKRSNPDLQFQAFATAGTMVALAALGQMLKDEWKYGETTPWLNQGEKVRRAIGASGLLGTGERLIDFVHPLYGESPWKPKYGENAIGQLGRVAEHTWGNIGPFTGTISNIYNLGESVVTDNGKTAASASRFLPLFGRSQFIKELTK